MIKAVLFDLDNTLIDFLKMKKISLEAAVDAMIDAGLKVNKASTLKKLYKIYDEKGMEYPKLFQDFLKEHMGKVDHRILAYGIVAYRKARTGFLEPYPHTDYVLLKLKQKGIKLGIITDAPRLKAWIRIVSMRLSNFFDAVVAFEDTKQLKPSRLPFRAALKKLNLKPEHCLMVGDWPERDIKGAKAIGMKTCFARYGNPKIKRTNADYEIDDIKNLLTLLERLNS